jgi:DNA-binding response OmpR family regulator
MRVLVIEDFEPLRRSIVKGLERAGMAVDHTGQGNEGLWYGRSNPYDVIILDLMLPGMDGLTILRKLRAEGFKQHVLVLTAKDTVEDRVRGLDAGADDYLVKPFAFEELLARVRALIRRTYQAKSPSVRVGPLRLDTAKQRVWVGQRSADLSAREYALLEFLALRAGAVVSRTEIWEHVYDFHCESDSNVVDVYICYLRRKLDEPGRPSLIQTVRGRGYRLGDGET